MYTIDVYLFFFFSKQTWRPVAAASPTVAPGDASLASSAGDVAGSTSGQRRRRVRKRRRNRDVLTPRHEGSGDAPPLVSSDEEPLTMAAGPSRRPRRVISRSALLERREADLAERALIVFVFAENPDGLKDAIISEIAHRFEIEAGLLSLHHLGRASYLLISPDETTARRISSTRRPISIPLGRLHIQRWSRLHNSSGGLLPIAMEIELRGIPTHAWDLDTAAQLLSDCCIPCGVHPETASQRKVFRLGAWCSDPGAIPPEIDLEIPEPEVIGRAARERRSLIYHVKISSRTAGVQVPADDPPPSTSQMDDDHRQRGR